MGFLGNVSGMLAWMTPAARRGKATEDVTVDYLRRMRDVTWPEMERRYGKETMKTMKIHLVVTVPAFWSERAKHKTLQAVSRANWNVSKISLVSEPEAAALYTIKGMMEGFHRKEVKVCYRLQCLCGERRLD
jgi:molecular chaperone DnaK (HSP70)